MSSHKSSHVTQTRAEILGLIETLRSARPANAQRPGGLIPPAPGKSAPYEELVDQIHELQRQRQLRGGPSQSIAPPRKGGQTSVPPLIRGLEQRLTRLEERLYAEPRKSEAPAAKGKGRDDDDWTFVGVIQGQLLSDMLQLVSSNSMSGLFVVEADDSRCEMYFDEGKMCHAVANGVTGEKAFFTAFASGKGKYRFRETTELPADRTITSSTQYLILEALRQIDEDGQK